MHRYKCNRRGSCRISASVGSVKDRIAEGCPPSCPNLSDANVSPIWEIEWHMMAIAFLFGSMSLSEVWSQKIRFCTFSLTNQANLKKESKQSVHHGFETHFRILPWVLKRFHENIFREDYLREYKTKKIENRNNKEKPCPT